MLYAEESYQTSHTAYVTQAQAEGEKKERKLYRRNTGFKGQHDRRIIFAYGDASLPSSMRSFTPTPSKVKWIYKNMQLYLIQAIEIMQTFIEKRDSNISWWIQDVKSLQPFQKELQDITVLKKCERHSIETGYR